MPVRRLLIVAALLCTLLPSAPALAVSQCFDAVQSPFCFDAPFAGYWDANGGLPVFGYPLTRSRSELNADLGHAFPTQWAQRNRFEYHAENAGSPYAVLLGLLGKERLRQLGRDPLAEPREAGPMPGCLWFAETGRNICNQNGALGFKAYWQGHGLKVPGLSAYAQSLQLFGLPLTSPQTETNANGNTVITQWFERARFEWHPTNPDQFTVLLGLLGTELRMAAVGRPEPADCAVVAPAPPTDAVDMWVTRPSVRSGESQTVCTRVTRQGRPERYMATSLRVITEDGWYDFIGLALGDGIARFAFTLGELPPHSTVTLIATYPGGVTAHTTYRVAGP